MQNSAKRDASVPVAAAAAETRAGKFRLRFDNPQFIQSVGTRARAPAQLHYLVFAGKSNVGKSSTINALCGGRYARVAKTPGRTRLINLFRLGHADSKTALADLPGYGYAAVSKQEQRGWSTGLVRFLRHADIRCLVIVVDCRRGIGELDRQLMALYAPRERPLLIVLNKMDKLTRHKQREALLAAHSAVASASVVPFSALKKTGVEALRAGLSDYLSAPVLSEKSL